LYVILMKTESAHHSLWYWNPHWFCIDFALISSVSNAS
jgi:hypothetical protein